MKNHKVNNTKVIGVTKLREENHGNIPKKYQSEENGEFSTFYMRVEN